MDGLLNMLRIMLLGTSCVLSVPSPLPVERSKRTCKNVRYEEYGQGNVVLVPRHVQALEETLDLGISFMSSASGAR